MAGPGRPVESGAAAPKVRYGDLSAGVLTGARARGAGWRLGVVVLVATLAIAAAMSASGSSGLGAGADRSVGHDSGSGPTISPESSPTVTAAPSQARVEWNTTVSVTGFSADTSLTLYFNGTPSSSGALTQGSWKSGGTGAFSGPVQVPALPAGSYYLNVTGGGDHASTGFTIEAPTLSLSPTVGVVASNTTVVGSGFAAGVTVSLTFNRTTIASASCASGTGLVANDWGNFSCTFAVPTYPAGTFNPVNATDAINTAGAFYTINRPTIALDPTTGDVGSSVVLTGSGFDPITSLVVAFGSTQISSCSSGSPKTNAYGDLSCDFPVPPVVAGTYFVNVTDDVNSAIPAPFVIGPPFLSLSVTRGPVGTTTTATGSGFEPSIGLSLDFNSTQVSACTSGTLTTGSTGDFSCAFTVPASTAGRQTTSATDNVNTATAAFVVTPSLVLSQPNGSFGTILGASGSGLDADASVSVSWNATYELCASVTDAQGSFSCSFTVPTAPAGAYTLTATEGRNAPIAAFEVDPALVLSASSSDVGQPESASGYGFVALASISVLWDHVTPECSGSTTNSNGAVTCDFLVPPAAGGEHNVSLVQGMFEVNRSLTVTTSFSIVPTAGVVGLSVELIGTGLQSSTVYLVCLETSLAICPGDSTSFSTDANGSIPPDTTFTIPSEIPGSYDLVISVGSFIAAEKGFVVTTGTLDLAPSSGPVGTSVSLSGSGYTPGTSYEYCFQSLALACPSTTTTTFTASSSGGIPSGTLLIVPASPAGVDYVDVSAVTSLVGATTFSLVSNVTGNATSATVGSMVTADGTGFPADASYELAWNSSVGLCDGTTNSTGGFTCSFAVVPAPEGPHTVMATSTPDAASFTLSILPAVSLSPAAALVGSTVETIGTGFAADGAFSVLWNASTTVCTGWTNASGSLSCSFSVPAAPAGAHPVSVVEAAINVTSSFSIRPSLLTAPSSGTVGSFALVTGTGLDARSSYYLSWNTSTDLCTGTTNGTGGFACAFSVPVAPAGPNSIEAVEGSNAPTVVFTVTPSVGLSSPEGPVASHELAQALGFTAGGAYSFWWNSSTKLCSGSANTNGEFDCSFSVPAVPAAAYNLTALEGGWSLSVPFTVVPSFLVSATAGTVSTLVGVSGSGFDADASFGLAWNSTTPLCAGTTSSNGNLSCSFEVPNAPGGAHTLVLTEGSHSVTTSFSVLPSLAISQLNGTVGSLVAVAGEGFAAGEPYAVSMTPTGGTLCSGTADVNGAFECTFVVPSVSAGMYTVTVDQGSTVLSSPFFVTSTVAPPASSTPFPWWLVALVGIGALVGVLAIYAQSRRQSAASRRSVEPWSGPAARMGGTGNEGGPLSSIPPGSSGPLTGSPAGPGDGRKSLGEYFVPPYRSSPDVPDSSRPAQAPESRNRSSAYDVDMLVARFGPFYEDALKGRHSSASPTAPVASTPLSSEGVREYIARLAPVYRSILKEKPPPKSG